MGRDPRYPAPVTAREVAAVAHAVGRIADSIESTGSARVDYPMHLNSAPMLRTEKTVNYPRLKPKACP